jgi:hypothetical protein
VSDTSASKSFKAFPEATTQLRVIFAFVDYELHHFEISTHAQSGSG